MEVRLARQTSFILILTSCLAAVLLGFASQSNPPIETPTDRGGAPTWEPRTKFPNDVFTFVRIRYRSTRQNFRTHWSGDYPDADLNFSHRLQELTSLQVAPEGLVFDLTDQTLLNYPFAYMSSPGRMYLSEDEALGLRRYVASGGFLMVDDFWGREHLENVEAEFSKVLPDLKPVNLPLSHPIFHIVYQLKEKPQVPSIRAWSMGHKIEPWHGDMTDPDPHFMGYFNAQGRLMILLCHNNDLADGWEREGENIEYFRRYSEPWSYPMGINIVVYAMTH
ncbi:MAG: hypothetical protein ACJASX_001717 [Limisphaerales bacterium]